MAGHSNSLLLTCSSIKFSRSILPNLLQHLDAAQVEACSMYRVALS